VEHNIIHRSRIRLFDDARKRPCSSLGPSAAAESSINIERVLMVLEVIAAPCVYPECLALAHCHGL
jgi:hypothetical protein